MMLRKYDWVDITSGPYSGMVGEIDAVDDMHRRYLLAIDELNRWEWVPEEVVSFRGRLLDDAGLTP